MKIEARGQRRWQAFKGLARPPHLGHLHKAPLATPDTGETVSIHRPKSLKPRDKDVTLSGQRLGSESLTPGGALSSRDPSLVLLPSSTRGSLGVSGRKAESQAQEPKNSQEPRRAGW